MKKASNSQNRHIWAAILMLLAATGIVVITYMRLYPVEAYIGPLQVYHWAGVSGLSIIGVFVPIYSVLKRHYPKTRRSLFDIHMYVNLFAFELVSLHFGILGQIKPQTDTGTGFLLYSVIALLVFTGILRRFQFARSKMQIWRFLHVSLTLSFYIIGINHILGALEIL